MNYAGLISLGQTLRILLQVGASGQTGVPTQTDALPKFRCYGSSGNLASANGTASQLETGVITGVTNANPAVVTSAAHGLTSGQRVTIASVVGSTGVNGTNTVTVTGSGTFSVPVAAGGAYVSGGTWLTTGLYAMDIVALGGNGFEQGKTYTVLATFAISAVVYSVVVTFTVV